MNPHPHILKKIVLSVIVLLGVVAYTLRQRGIFFAEDAEDGIPIQVNAVNIPGTSEAVNTNSSSTPSSATTNTSGTVTPLHTTNTSTGMMQGQYTNGTYTSGVEDAFYGNVQIQVTVASGQVSEVAFLQYPNTHRTSVLVNQEAMPLLRQEAITAQSANVNLVSGATYTSLAFRKAMESALAKAK